LQQGSAPHVSGDDFVARVMPESSQLNSAVACGLSSLRSRKWRSRVVIFGAFMVVAGQFVVSIQSVKEWNLHSKNLPNQ
jgi:hypothetical protein